MAMATTVVVPYSTPIVSGIFPLGHLPNEILLIIFEQLTLRYKQRDIARLRLVCKRFADIGNRFLLSEAHLFFKPSQFEQLRQISEHPIISKKIDTLFYEADVLQDYGSMPNWKANICIPIWMKTLSPKSLPPPPTASAREERAYNRSLNKAIHGPQHPHTGTLLRRAYDKYAAHLADQESMRQQDYNLEMLKDALMKMPNLKTIEMSTECCLGRSTGMEQAFKDGLAAPYGDTQSDEGCGVGQLRSLLLAADAAGLKFETLAAGNVDWRFFRESEKQGLEVLQKMQHAVRSLRTLRLYISTRGEDDEYVYFDDLAHSMLPECAKHLYETFHLKDFITSTPALERLDVNFDCDEPYPPATLGYIVGTFKWHSLRVASFSYISTDEDCLAQFFDRHADTLRKLRLETISLNEGSWPSLLRHARKTLKLEQAALSGRLKSLEAEEVYYFDLPAGLNGGKKAKIQVVVEEYLVEGGEGPLLDLYVLVEKHRRKYVYPDENMPGFVDTETDEVIMDRF